MTVGVYNAAENYYRSPIAPYFPGSTVAGMTANQRQGYETNIGATRDYIDTAQDIANRFKSQADNAIATGGVNRTTVDNVNAIGASFDPFNNSALTDAIAAMRGSARRDFNQNVAPYIHDKAIASGNAGSSRAGIAEGLLRSNFENSLAEQEAKMRMEGFQTGMQMYVNDRSNTLNAARGFGQDAVRTLDNYATRSTLPRDARADYAGSMQAYGSAQQALNQARLNDSVNRYNYAVNEPYNRLANYVNLLNGSPGSSATTSSVVTQGPGVNWGQFAQGMYRTYSQPQPQYYNPYRYYGG